MFKKFFVVCTLVCTLALTGAVSFSGCSGAAEAGKSSNPIELRGVWLTNEGNILRSRQKIAEAMQFLDECNFNTVFPVVWENGMTLHRSEVMKATFGFEIDTLVSFKGRDPLAELIEEAHKRNIAVIPCFEGGFSAGDANSIILRTKPEWAARDRTNKIVMKDGVAWLNAFHPDVQGFMTSLVMEVARKYEIDGIQGTRRFPAQPIEAGYDSLFYAEYTELHAGNPPPLDIHEKHWKYWRVVRLNTFARQLYWKVKALRPGAVVSWAVGMHPRSVDEYLQDWRAWTTKGADNEYYADLVHPEIHLTDIKSYERLLDSQHRDSLRIFNPKRYMYPAMVFNKGASGISDEFLKEAVRYNRFSGYNGEVFVSYSDLRNDNDRLAKVLKETYYKTPARLPFERAGRQNEAR